MSHTELLRTECDLCSKRVVTELPVRRVADEEWMAARNPPDGWVDISEAGEFERHVCKECVDKIVECRAVAEVAERAADIERHAPGLKGIMGDES